MNDNLKRIPDFDDLLFEKRNKEYGAYRLRKKYNSVLTAGIIFASIIFSLAVILPFLVRPKEGKVLSGGSGYVQARMDNYEPPEEQIYVPPAAPPPETRQMEEIVRYVPPEVVDSVLINEKQMATADDLISQPTETETEYIGEGNGDDLLTGQPGNGSDEPFVMVEVMPLFRGGDINKFREWVQKRTTYPQEAINRRIQGRVNLTFIVEPDGSVSNVTVLKGVDPLIDDEAVKSIIASPKWTPGLQRGKPVRVRYSMWLSFVI